MFFMVGWGVWLCPVSLTTGRDKGRRTERTAEPPSSLVVEFGTHLLVALQRRLLRCQLFSDHCR